MRSFKNHLSLILAIATILFSLQIFTITDRAITAYESNLQENYSIVVVSEKRMDDQTFRAINPLIKSSEEIQTEHVLNKIKTQMKQTNVELLKIALPKFYRIHLTEFPSPDQISTITSLIKKQPGIKRIESFTNSHNTTYKLLLLFKQVVLVLALFIFAVTSLLMLKEMRIWQFQHTERMSIMALFGAPVWLRSAVLFRLSIVDALIATLLTVATFITILHYGWIESELDIIGIHITIFDLFSDGVAMLSLALSLSIFLASMIMLGHKEEV
ncbi:MAG: cell division protein FtsX [Campylobacterota bacterium]|nr:cell division protein FtsX [Campylobacterota bacterium]